jgi:hypothetical protein
VTLKKDVLQLALTETYLDGLKKGRALEATARTPKRKRKVSAK